jgi:hypothetical protein
MIQIVQRQEPPVVLSFVSQTPVTGKNQWMQDLYGEGLATLTNPGSWGLARKGQAEALTGAWPGRGFGRESHYCHSERRAAPEAEEKGIYTFISSHLIIETQSASVLP